MNKKEMVAKLAKKTGLSQAKATDVIDAIFAADPGEGIIAVELDAGRKVTITGFGTSWRASAVYPKYCMRSSW